MATRHFHIEITPDALNVSSSQSAHSVSGRPGLNIVVMAIAVAVFLWLTCRRDPYGYNLWRYLARYPLRSGTFLDNLVLVLLTACVTGLVFVSALRAFFPSGETVHCDRSRLTISKIPWISFRGKWRTNWFPLSEVKGLSFAVLQSGKGESIYGIRFHTFTGKEKMLAGLTAPQAYKILGALKKLGADVPDHHDMRDIVREALRDQREQL